MIHSELMKINDRRNICVENNVHTLVTLDITYASNNKLCTLSDFFYPEFGLLGGIQPALAQG